MVLAPEDRDKTAFVCKTPNDMKTYVFKVGCLGLAGMPASYQAWMESVIFGIDGCRVYLDDISYYATVTIEEHLLLLRKCFQRFRDKKVYLRPQKCEWGVSEMDFLGMHVTFHKVTISEEKIAALKIYPVPGNFPAVRRFMGFVGHMQQFIPHFSTLAAPLTDMLRNQDEKKKKKFLWTSTEQNAFDKIIKDLCYATGLMMPDLRGQFVMETDASALGVGATLYQFVDDK